MMKLQDILPTIIDSIVCFYIEYNRRIYNNEIIIKHPELLYIDMYKRIYYGYTLKFHTDEVYEISILPCINPGHTTYNKLSDDNNILETLVTYIEEFLIRFRIPMSKDNIIISLDIDVPFEIGIDVDFGWIKSVIDIYR